MIVSCSEPGGEIAYLQIIHHDTSKSVDQTKHFIDDASHDAAMNILTFLDKPPKKPGRLLWRDVHENAFTDKEGWERWIEQWGLVCILGEK